MIIPAIVTACVVFYLYRDFTTWKRSQEILSRLAKFRLQQ